MRFPQIRLLGDKAKAFTYIRRGMQELFRLHEMQRTSKVPILQKTVEVNEYVTILVQISKEQEFVDITYLVPTQKEKAAKKYEPPTQNLPYCPPAFILYARKRFTGVTNKDYIIVYDELSKTWVLATVDPYTGASNVGYWHNHKEGSFHGSCDLVTWDGQAGGFGDLGHCHYTGNELNSGFYIGGQKINSPSGLFGVYVTDDYFYSCNRIGSALLVYRGNKVTSPTWTVTQTYTYTDYADVYNGNEKTTWPQMQGVAYISPEGKAFFSMPICKRIENIDEDGNIIALMINHLLCIDMVSGNELTVVRSDIDAAPSQYHYAHTNYVNGGINTGSNVYRIFPDAWNMCSGDMIQEAQGAQIPGGCDIETATQSWGGSYSNKNRPMLLRTFGGLASLYTYEFEINWQSDGTFSCGSTGFTPISGQMFYTAANCIPAYQIPHMVKTWGFRSDYLSNRQESQNGTATVYCYDNGTNGGERRIIDKINVWELKLTCAVSSQGVATWDATNQTLVDITNNYYDPSNSHGGLFSLVAETEQPTPGSLNGSARLSIIHRTIIDHHPEIKNSWVYIETERSYDLVAGTREVRTVRFVDMLRDEPLAKYTTSEIWGDVHYGNWVWDGYDDYPKPGVLIDILYGANDAAGDGSEGYYVRPKFQPVEQTPVDIEGWDVSTDWSALYHRGFYEDLFTNTLAYNRSYFSWGSYTIDPHPVTYGAFVPVGLGSYGYVWDTFGDLAIKAHNYRANTYGDGWAFRGGGTIEAGGNVAVHRKLNGIRPYIWLKRKVHTDFQSKWGPQYVKADLRRESATVPFITSSSMSPYDYDITHTAANTSWQYVFGSGSETSDDVIFWTRELSSNASGATNPSPKTHHQRLADEGEWYIESNVLSDEQILALTKEASLDIYAIAIV